LKAGNTANILESVKNGELDMGFVEGNINDMDIKKRDNSMMSNKLVNPPNPGIKVQRKEWPTLKEPCLT